MAEGTPAYMRRAFCGHLYRAPAPQGRARNFCQDCALKPKQPGRCLDCGNALSGNRAGRKRCAPCGELWRQELACEVCGTSLAKRRASRFCSKRCANIFHGICLYIPLPDRVCALPGCDVTFTPHADRQHCCCEAHGKKYWKIKYPDKVKAGREPWGDKRRAAYHKRRALRKGASTGQPVVFSEIAERDRWKCHLCGKRVLRKPWPHPRSASLDHLVPLSQGGLHDPTNVRLAHLTCNSVKGTRGGNEQLLLIG